MGVKPQWEHGYRCHGYWIGIIRFGWVSLGPAGCTRAKRDGYGWGFTPPAQPSIEGREPTLRAAKLRVEEHYQKAALLTTEKPCPT